MNWRRVAHIVRKELIQLRRDPQLLRIVLISPVFQLFIFGYAITTDVRHVSTGIWDEDRSAESRRLTEAFTRSAYFEQRHWLSDEGEVNRVMDTGSAQLVLRIPRGFAADLAGRRTARVQVILDGADSMTAGIIGGYAAGVLRQYSGRIAGERLARMRHVVPRVPSVRERLRVWYNPDLKSVNFMVPGVLSLILLIVTTLLTALAIVKEREIGTLEQIVVTPITGGELVLGKTIPYVFVGYLDMLLVLVVALYWFGVRPAGSIPLLFILAGAFILTCLGIGLLISTISQTQQQAMMAMFFVMLPSILLSGFMFPIENMPRVVQYLTYAIPLRYFLVIIRGIFLKGNGLDVLWPQLAVMLSLGLAILALAALRFRKRLG